MAVYYFRMATNRLALKLARRFYPRLVWSGAGVVVRKSYLERGAGGGWITMVPAHLQQGWVSGTRSASMGPGREGHRGQRTCCRRRS